MYILSVNSNSTVTGFPKLHCADRIAYYAVLNTFRTIQQLYFSPVAQNVNSLS